ncbi:MAG: hypothetical protein ACFHWX_06230 [Bacteroidota bacterium]
MKLISKIILIATLTYFSGFILPWWTVMVVSFIICFLIEGSGVGSFVSGFLGGGLVWLAYSWYIDVKTQSIMSSKIIELFPFDDQIMLVLIAGLVGAFAGGISGVAGNSFKLIFKKKKAKSFYS